MNYYVADTYKYMERIGEPFEKDGKMYTNAQATCDRCGGSGVFASHVENGHIVPHPAYGGVCLKCNGSGKIEKVIRLYTEKEYNAAQRAKERRRIKSAEAAEARAKARKAKAFATWLERNGFDSDGNTYLIYGNTYPIKEELKVRGFKFSPELKWHGPEAVDVPEDCYIDQVHWSSIYNWDEHSCEMFETEEGQRFLEDIFTSHTLGEYVGEIGERLRSIPVIFQKVTTFDGRYGETNVYRFLYEGAQLTWFTQVDKDLEEGAEYILTGTVKEHKPYGNVKTTYLSRCIIKED